VVKPGKTFNLVAQNPLSSGIMASPVVADGILYLRTETALYAIGQAP
jgi:hypothetical protein